MLVAYFYVPINYAPTLLPPLTMQRHLREKTTSRREVWLLTRRSYEYIRFWLSCVCAAWWRPFLGARNQRRKLHLDWNIYERTRDRARAPKSLEWVYKTNTHITHIITLCRRNTPARINATHTNIYLHTHTHIYIHSLYIYIYSARVMSFRASRNKVGVHRDARALGVVGYK